MSKYINRSDEEMRMKLVTKKTSHFVLFTAHTIQCSHAPLTANFFHKLTAEIGIQALTVTLEIVNESLNHKRMAFTREVITLQIGNYSNYVGTHWWNIQVS